MHPFTKNVRTSSIRVIVKISLCIALVLCAVSLIGVGMAPSSGINLSVDFDSNVTSGTAPLAVAFTGISENATKWEWDLGDGIISDVKDPSHIYFAPGVYNVTLTVSDMNETVTESKENYILVYQPVMPEAYFDVNVTSGYAPLTVAFTDHSSDAVSWDWNFGDGSANSTVQNPTHTYSAAGTYTVILTAVNENGTSTESKIDFITVLEVPTYHVSPEVDGGTASIVVDRPTAEEGQTVNVTVSDIQAGKQFASINVAGESIQVTATEVIPGVIYTFTMPAENVTVTVTLEDIPVVTTYDIQTEVIGGNATVTTDPAGAAEKGTNVTININDIELGRQFKSITVKSGSGKPIEISEQSPGMVYTFIMPEKRVTVTVELEDSPVSTVIVTGIEVSKPPAKESYIEGETLDLTELVVRLTRSDSSTVDVAFEEFAGNGLTTTPTNGSTLSIANTNVTITHTDGAIATQQIDVSAVTITGISIEKVPTKVNYTAGETLDLTGLVVRLTKSNGSTVYVKLADFAANNLTTTPANGVTLSTANTIVTITHIPTGYIATQVITVSAAPVMVTKITVAGSGNSTSVEKGKTLQMNAAILPDNASNKNVVWSVVNGSGTASISSTTGLLTGTGAGTVTVVATAADGSGVQDTIEITITETQSTTTASSGGGGGGGGQSTGEKNENIGLKDYSIKYVLKDTETLFEFTKEGNSIISLGYTASLNGGQTKAIIEMLKGTSTLVNKAAPGVVYKNMNIWVGDGKTPAMLSDARIMFRVEKSWLSQNRIDPANIRMCRYNSGSWAQLPTSMTGEDDTYVYYLARTPGFSAFAISSINEAQQAASTGVQQGSPTIQNEGSMQMSTADSKTSETTNAVSQEAQSAVSFTLLLIIAAITALGVLSYRRRDYLSQVRMQLGNPDGKRYRRLKKNN